MSTRHASIRTHLGKFKLSITAGAGASHVAYLRKHLLAAWPLIEHAPAELSLALVDDDRMSQLHRQFLKIDGPTDVLTFELEHSPVTARCTGGEVIVCVPEAQRSADRLCTTVQTELLLYAVHGLLHLSGLDDRTAGDFAIMHRREDEILAAIGVGRVFAARPTAKPSKHVRTPRPRR